MDKSIFNFKVQKKDNSIIDLHNKDLWVSSFRIPSPSPNHSTETVDGKHGSIYLGSTLESRVITATISIEAFDYVDFDLFRDELFRIFDPLEKFYIIRDLQPGKRIEVSVSQGFDIDYETLEDGEFSIEFIIHSTFFESVGTTLELDSFESTWQIGQGLTSNDVKYMHSTNSFEIYNAGDIKVDPRSMPIFIEFTGKSNNLSIENVTTGDKWTYNESTSIGDTIKLDRVKSYKNELKITGSTNKKVITLNKGYNQFNITGTDGSFEIKFDFRFYYY